MHTYITYEIRLLSDTCCGTGSGNGSDVDVAVCVEKNGLPEIPGRRIKGLMREKAMLLAENGVCTKEAVEALFGMDGGVTARVSIDNARLEHADEIARSVCGYSPREVSNVFIQKRTRTAIGVDGTAKKHSLHTIETVVKGTTFIGEIKITDTQDGDVSFIEKTLKLLRGIGHGKTRGLGEVACRIIDIRSEEMPTISYEKNGERMRLDYTLELMQDVVLMAGSPTQTADYIGGSALQGAMARIFAGYDYFDTLFFDDLFFSNAYIAAPERFLPIPFSVKAVKNEDAFFYNVADGYAYEEQLQYTDAKGYGLVYENKYHVAEPEVGIEYHIRKKEQLLYTYNKLSRGQRFCGVIEGSQAAIQAVKVAVAAMGGMVKIGASGTAQYGKCGICLSEPYMVEQLPVAEGETVIAECVSDTILYDAWGKNAVTEEALQSAFSEWLAFENMQVYAKIGTTGGYNAKWGMPKVRAEAYSMGTTVVLLGCGACSLPESMFIGNRNYEGYGEIRFRKLRNAQLSKVEVSTKKESEGETVENEIVQKLEANRIAKSIALQGTKDAEIAYTKYTGLSDSASMRLLSAYQALVKNGIPTSLVEDYEGFIQSFSANRELYALAKEILKKFKRLDHADGVLFSLYIKNFIGRYKELSQTEKKGAKL